MYSAKIIFYGKEHGGRSNPPLSGYRPQLKVGDEFTSCIIKSKDEVEIFDFEKEHLVNLELMFPDVYREKIKSIKKIELYEGSKLVGEGMFV